MSKMKLSTFVCDILLEYEMDACVCNQFSVSLQEFQPGT